MNSFAFHVILVLALTDLLLQFVHCQALVELDEVIQHHYAKACNVVQKIGVGAFFLVDDVGQGKVCVIIFQEGVLGVDELDLFLLGLGIDLQGAEGGNP